MRLPHWMAHAWDRWSEPWSEGGWVCDWTLEAERPMTIRRAFQRRACRVCGLVRIRVLPTLGPGK